MKIGFPTARPGRLINALFAALLLAGCSVSQPRSTAPRDAFRRLEIGLCEDYPEESRSLAAARRDLRLAATNDIRTLRIAFGWDAMEPEPGKFDWSFWDEFVRLAADEYRIRLVPYLCYTPRWASTSDRDDFWRHPPKDPARFAAFVREIVARYRDRIDSWELWNEPDNPAYWAGTVEQFAELLAAGARAVREADPDATIVFGGLAWNLNFLESVLTNPAAMRHIDVVNLHNYFETWSSDPVENLPDYVGRAHDLLRQNGFRQELWMAEGGFSSHRSGAHVSGQYQARYRHEHTEEDQAAVLWRVMTLLAASEKVSLAAWYRINDLPQTQEVIGDVNNRHLGVLDRQGRAKPALRSLAYFRSQFRHGFRLLDREVRIEKAISAPVHAHAFEKPDGSVLVVAWLKNHVPGERAPGSDGGEIDSRRADVTFSFPASVEADATITDQQGELQQRVTLKRAGDRRIARLQLHGGTVTLFHIQRNR